MNPNAWSSDNNKIFLKLPWISCNAVDHANDGVELPLLVKLYVDKNLLELRVLISDLNTVCYERLAKRQIYSRVREGLPADSQVESFQGDQSDENQVAALINELEEALGLESGGQALSAIGRDRTLVASCEPHSFGMNLTIKTSSLDFGFSTDFIDAELIPGVIKDHFILSLVGVLSAILPLVDEAQLQGAIDRNAELSKLRSDQQLKRSFGSRLFSTSLQRWQDTFRGRKGPLLSDNGKPSTSETSKATSPSTFAQLDQPAELAPPTKRRLSDSPKDERPAKAARSESSTKPGKAILDASRRDLADRPQGRQYTWNEEETQYPKNKGKGKAVVADEEERRPPVLAKGSDSATEDEVDGPPAEIPEKTKAPAKDDEATDDDETPPLPPDPKSIGSKSPAKEGKKDNSKEAAAEAERRRILLNKVKNAQTNVVKKKKKTF